VEKWFISTFVLKNQSIVQQIPSIKWILGYILLILKHVLFTKNGDF